MGYHMYVSHDYGEIYSSGHSVVGVDLCNCILLAEQVKFVAWLYVSYLYNHEENNLQTNFLSTSVAWCLHPEKA